MALLPVSRDEQFMQRAMSLAMRGRGTVEPNPMVGCAIVRDDRAIGEGYHRRYGGSHAEPDALASCLESPAGATVFVNLEPCCHSNKQTPPCVPRLIEARVGRVVVGCSDPNPSVAGKGIAELRAAGIDVSTGVCEAEARQLNAAFFAHVLHRRPYVTLKWAQSADGKIGAAGVPGLRISNDTSHRLIHSTRARCDAILVGRNTVSTDDPLLTARGVEGPRPLRRVVLDGNLQISPASRLVTTARESPLTVYCSQAAFEARAEQARALQRLGVEVTPLHADASNRIPLTQVLADLGQRSITHLLVEPGPTLARSFLAGHFADRVWVIRSNQRLATAATPLDAEAVDYPAAGKVELDGDELTEYLNPASDVFFGLFPSADLRLATSDKS